MIRHSSCPHLSFVLLFLTVPTFVTCHPLISPISFFDSSPSSPSSPTCNDGDACSHQLSAASIIALTFVTLFFFLLICWCSGRVLLATILSRPLPSFLSLCRRSNPQIHLHLHSSDNPPALSAPPHPSTLTLYPFHGHYRIGSNLQLTPFTLLLHFHPFTSPRTVTGEGVDNAQPFFIHHGLFTSRGGEVRCTFEEQFEDGSRYCFSGVGEEGVGGRWKGEWWKEGGEQGGVWMMEPDEERWREMEEERGRGGEGGEEGVGDGQAGWTRRGWRERRATVMGRELEEQKEVGQTDEGRHHAEVERRVVEGEDMMIEMTDLSHPRTVITAIPTPAIDQAEVMVVH